MLSADVIREVRRLLDEDELSQRAIAARLNISRGVVNAVAHRRRDEHGPRSRWANPQPAGAYPDRCPTCGGLVFMPCRLCTTRAFAERQRLLLMPTHPQEPPPPRRAA
jgi:hypothetical protein